MALLIIILVLLALIFGGVGLAVEGLRLLFWIGIVFLVFAIGSYFFRGGRRY